MKAMAWTSEEILGNLNAPTWLGAYTPDVVLVHLGTNDVFGYTQASDAESTLSNMRLSQPFGPTIQANLLG